MSECRNTTRALSNMPTISHDPFDPGVDAQAIELLGDGLRRLFVIWNRGYKTACVVAEDVHEALHLAVAAKHIKRAAQYRRFDDVTDRALAGEEVDELGVIDGLDRILNLGRSGLLARDGEGALSIDGNSTLAM